MVNLGELHAQGWGARKITSRPGSGMRRPTAGDATAMVNLGRLHEQGWGGARDYRSPAVV